MSKQIIWHCIVCNRKLEVLKRYIISSYRVSRYDRHGRICVDCLRSKENFVRKGLISQI